MLHPRRRRRPCQGPAASLMGALDGKVAFITGAAPRSRVVREAVGWRPTARTSSRSTICDQIASVPYPLATTDDLAATVKLVEDTGARIVAREADVRDKGVVENWRYRRGSTSSAGSTSWSPTRASRRWKQAPTAGETSSTSTSPACTTRSRSQSGRWSSAETAGRSC